MAKATITNISDHRPPQQPEQPPEPNQEDAARLRRKLKWGDHYFSMEEPLKEIRDMAGLAAQCIEDAIGSSHEKITGDPELFLLSRRLRRQMIFSIYHLQDMIEKAVDDWDTNMSGSAPDAEPPAA